MPEEEQTWILVTAPTVWPFMLALGIALIFTGLVTHPVVSIVGAIVLLCSSIGWWFDVLPEQKEEIVPVSPAVQVVRSSLTVDHLAAGHRVQIPVEVHPYWTGIWGGLPGAAARAVGARSFVVMSQGGSW